jgi:hypothetical protein
MEWDLILARVILAGSNREFANLQRCFYIFFIVELIYDVN